MEVEDKISAESYKRLNSNQMNEDLFVNPAQKAPSYSSTGNIEEGRKKKVPRRILHFSDGVMEEYSTDEEEDEPEPPKPVVNPKTLPWHKWFWHYMTSGAVQSLAAADYCGEKLAWFFGITTPKYQYYIDEYNRMKAEEKDEEEKEQKEFEEWKKQRGLVDLEDPDHQTTHDAGLDNPCLQTTHDAELDNPCLQTTHDDCSVRSVQNIALEKF